MYNPTLMHLAYLPVFCIMFTGGICTGSLIGLTLGIMDSTSIGILGGTFITFLSGLASGLVGIIYTAVFNTLAPVMGGFPMQITPKATESNIPPMPTKPSC